MYTLPSFTLEAKYAHKVVEAIFKLASFYAFINYLVMKVSKIYFD